MFFIVTLLIKLILFPLSKAKQEYFVSVVALVKENHVLKRKFSPAQIRGKLSLFDRLFFASIAHLFQNIKEHITIVKPETVLSWVRKFQKRFWSYPHKKKKTGRPPITKNIKDLVLKIKNGFISIGNGQIRGELLKLGIDISESSIARILAVFRKKGKVRKGITWSQFIKSHLNLYGMDFFTVDTIFNIRYYVFFILHIGSRKIIQFGVTKNPTKEFVRQQLIDFSNDYCLAGKSVYLIHDRAGEFFYQNYEAYHIKNIPIAPYSPNMNAHAERWVGSIRRECLDWFIIFTEKQLRKLVSSYITYYNSLRPHQGLDQKIPTGYTPQTEGEITSISVLSGLRRHFFRSAA
jgi:hypothetical protein